MSKKNLPKTDPLQKADFALAKKNFIIIGIAALLVFLGFILMAVGPITTEHGFEPDIFSTRRIVVAPMIILFGFLLGIVGILFPIKDENKSKEI